MYITLSELIALLALIGSTIFGTYTICRNIFTTKK